MFYPLNYGESSAVLQPVASTGSRPVARTCGKSSGFYQLDLQNMMKVGAAAAV